VKEADVLNSQFFSSAHATRVSIDICMARVRRYQSINARSINRSAASRPVICSTAEMDFSPSSDDFSSSSPMLSTPIISSSSAPSSPSGLYISTARRRLFSTEPSDPAWMDNPAADMPDLHSRPAPPRPNPASFTPEARQRMLLRRLSSQQPPNAPKAWRIRRRVF